MSEGVVLVVTVTALVVLGTALVVPRVSPTRGRVAAGGGVAAIGLAPVLGGVLDVGALAAWVVAALAVSALTAGLQAGATRPLSRRGSGAAPRP